MVVLGNFDMAQRLAVEDAVCISFGAALAGAGLGLVVRPRRGTRRVLIVSWLLDSNRIDDAWAVADVWLRGFLCGALAIPCGCAAGSEIKAALIGGACSFALAFVQ